jgi:hypothetical protein
MKCAAEETPQQLGYSSVVSTSHNYRGAFWRRMKDDTIERVFEALDEAFGAMGYDRFDEGIAKVAGLFKQIAEGTSVMGNRDRFRDWLREIPDFEEPAELEQFIRLLSGLVYTVRQIAPEVAKRMPHDPGGAPSVTTPEERRKICAEIDRMYDNGLRRGVALQRIAKRYNVSVRTVQRISKEREIT